MNSKITFFLISMIISVHGNSQLNGEIHVSFRLLDGFSLFESIQELNRLIYKNDQGEVIAFNGTKGVKDFDEVKLCAVMSLAGIKENSENFNLEYANEIDLNSGHYLLQIYCHDVSGERWCSYNYYTYADGRMISLVLSCLERNAESYKNDFINSVDEMRIE